MNPEFRRNELEQEIILETRKLKDASKRAAGALRENLELLQWLRDNPGRSISLAALIGFALGKMHRARLTQESSSDSLGA